MKKRSNSFFLTTVQPALNNTVQHERKISKASPMLAFNSSQILPTLTQTFKSYPSKFNSKLKYLDSFKNIRKIQDIRSHHIQPQTPISSYLSKILENNLTPMQFGLIKEKGVCDKLEFLNTYIGPKYVEALSEYISSLKIYKIQLKQNSLNDKSLFHLISGFNFKYLFELRISENSFGPESIKKLSSLIPQPSFSLRILYLDNCNLSDKSIITLTTVLLHFDKIKELSISKNKIQEEGAIALASVIYDTECLEILDISWNTIRGYGGKEICKVLGSNTSLKYLNVAWNSFGNPTEAQCSKALSESLIKNSYLLHLNMSHTHFDQNDCEVIKSGLSQNFTLLGLDFEGNNGKVDSQGRIYTTKTSENDENSLKMCWICGNWNEVMFNLIEAPTNFTDVTRLKLHLHFEEFSPCDILRSGTGFSTVRMCPPGKIFFYFTYENKIILEPSYKRVKNTLEAFPGIYQVNVIDNKPSPRNLWMELKPKALPRSNFLENPKDAITLLSKEYNAESAEFIDECFEEDVLRTNLKILTGKDFNNVITHLKPYYPAIKDTYKSLAAKAWLDWDAWEEVLKKFVIKGKIFKDSEKPLKDLDNIVKTYRYWNSTSVVYFTRYNFLEILVRIAITKYYQTKQVKKLYQGVKIFFREYSDCFSFTDFQKFRTEKMSSGPIERIFSKQNESLMQVFYAHCTENLLSFSGFQKILFFIPSQKLLQESFIYSKESSALFAYFDDTLKFSEFLEALARVLYKFYYKKIVSSNSVTLKTESSDSDQGEIQLEEFFSSSLSTIFNSI